ncbi:beta-1,4-glucuronyltransferase 1 isoform X2 [Lycorma delicatula]|uniref:beta-1,4-glucuronyltransferase 1 isoform X2 n=1 Tax=Lycorma delicatula TaxID=130591 RepID=UPI003F516A8D
MTNNQCNVNTLFSVSTTCRVKRRKNHRFNKIGCRLWNVSLIIVLLLTLCNIMLTVRLLHTECPHPIIQASQLKEALEKGQNREKISMSSAADERIKVIKPCLQFPTSLPCNFSRGSQFFNVDTRIGRWDNRRMYKMFDGAVVGEKYGDVSQKYSVCLATQSSIEKMYSIVEVSQHWTGPISVALFAAGDMEYKLMKGYVKYLRRCYSTVRERVIFHVMFPKEKVPSTTNKIESTDNMDCEHPDLVLNSLLKMRTSDVVRWRVRNPYPQNHLRNLARKNCQTNYVFLTDVDIIPSNNLADELNAFLKETKCKGHCAYVIPTFELDERVRFPRNKTDLIRLAGKGLARPFHQKVFIYNQFATNTSRWMKDSGPNELHVSHNVTNFEFLYEPFYVAPDTVPPHDERFIGYGFTRNSQVYEMHLAGYQFQVLSPVFSCHWGLQVRNSRPSWREAQNSRNRRNFDGFKREIFARYNKPLPTRKPPVQKPPQSQPQEKDKEENKDKQSPARVALL